MHLKQVLSLKVIFLSSELNLKLAVAAQEADQTQTNKLCRIFWKIANNDEGIVQNFCEINIASAETINHIFFVFVFLSVFSLAVPY